MESKKWYKWTYLQNWEIASDIGNKCMVTEGLGLTYTHCSVLCLVAWSCPTLCDPMDCIVHGLLQARILEWVVFPLSRGSSQPRDRTQVSALQADFLLVGSPRILYWVAYHFSSGCSWPRNWTWVSCIAGQFFTNWAIRICPIRILGHILLG